MKIKHLMEALAAYDPEADAQICVRDEEDESHGFYYDVGKVVPLMGAKDAIIEPGDFRCG